jgi:regulator of replication initiation timing
VTEIGLRQERADSEIECSVLLRTEEISTRVEAKIQPTVPFVVHEIIEQCSPQPGTVGTFVIVLDNDSEVEGFGYAIGYGERRHPYVLVSPTQDGTYLVDIEKLRFVLEGLADVVQIPIGADTFLIERLLGKQYAAWRGAVNIIFPEVQIFGRSFAPTKRLLPDTIDDIVEDGSSPETEILSIITHRTNLPNSWRHISPETVAEIIRRRELARLQREASETGESAEYIQLLEEDNKEKEEKLNEHQQRLGDLQAEIDGLNGVVSQTDDENRRLRFEIDGLRLSLSYAGGSGEGAAAETVSESVREVLDIAADSFTLSESLRVITILFPDRIEALESAWKSASDSEIFKQKKKAFELLLKLATDYWNELASGRGDAEARATFGNAYSAKESETVETNKQARKLRTFRYKDQDVEMMKHLKIGIKDSIAETLRIHFEWDPDERKIVIGHCGHHLDHK